MNEAYTFVGRKTRLHLISAQTDFISEALEAQILLQFGPIRITLQL